MLHNWEQPPLIFPGIKGARGDTRNSKARATTKRNSFALIKGTCEEARQEERKAQDVGLNTFKSSKTRKKAIGYHEKRNSATVQREEAKSGRRTLCMTLTRSILSKKLTTEASTREKGSSRGKRGPHPKIRGEKGRAFPITVEATERDKLDSTSQGE